MSQIQRAVEKSMLSMQPMAAKLKNKHCMQKQSTRKLLCHLEAPWQGPEQLDSYAKTNQCRHTAMLYSWCELNPAHVDLF